MIPVKKFRPHLTPQCKTAPEGDPGHGHGHKATGQAEGAAHSANEASNQPGVVLSMIEILHEFIYIHVYTILQNSYTFGIRGLYKVMQDFYHQQHEPWSKLFIR